MDPTGILQTTIKWGFKTRLFINPNYYLGKLFTYFDYPLKLTVGPGKSTVGRLISFWDGPFSGAMSC